MTQAARLAPALRRKLLRENGQRRTANGVKNGQRGQAMGIGVGGGGKAAMTWRSWSGRCEWNRKTGISRGSVKNSQGWVVTSIRDVEEVAATVGYEYDAFGNPTTITASGSSAVLEYDLRGRKTKMKDPDMGGNRAPVELRV